MWSRGRKSSGRKRILAVASSGGHWVQLMRLRPAFAGHDVAYATVQPAYRAQVGGARFYRVPDATRWNKARLLLLAARIAWILLRERPDVVVSTGAAPGYFALRLAALAGAQTIWIDSMAFAEHMSMSGQKIGKHATVWLTQWPQVARPEGPYYCGAVL